MSSKHKGARQKQNRYRPLQPQPAAQLLQKDAPKQGLVKRLLDMAQSDDVSKMRLIVICVLTLLVIEFVVFAIALSGDSAPLLQSKNPGQQLPINDTGGGTGCNVGIGSSNPTSPNPQSPGTALQNSPVPQGQSSGLSAGDSLQASPQAGQCF